MPVPTDWPLRGRSVKGVLAWVESLFLSVILRSKALLRADNICSTEILKRIQSSREIKTIVTKLSAYSIEKIFQVLWLEIYSHCHI